MDHTWIAHRWVVDLGLPQYSSAFDAQLLDGRILNVLTRKDLEKHLSVHRKFHQASILHGIELLRRVSFDKEVSPITSILHGIELLRRVSFDKEVRRIYRAVIGVV